LAAIADTTLTPCVRRKRSLPPQFKQFLVDSTIGNRDNDLPKDADPQSFYRAKVYHPVLDSMLSEMKRRFCVDSNSLVRAAITCHPSNSNFLDTHAIIPLAEAYNINMKQLSSEIDVCRNIISCLPHSPNGIADVINLLQPACGFPRLRQLLQLVLTIPIANVSAERSFSALRRIRTYLRSKMSFSRLTGLAIMNIERNLTRNVDLDSMVDIFVYLPNTDLEHSSKRKINL
jgi:hypothetical protein